MRLPSRGSKIFAPISPPGTMSSGGSSSEPTPDPSPVRAVKAAKPIAGVPILPDLDGGRPGRDECTTPRDFGEEFEKTCPEKPQRPAMQPLLASFPGTLSSFAGMRAFPGLSLPDVRRQASPANAAGALGAGAPVPPANGPGAELGRLPCCFSDYACERGKGAPQHNDRGVSPMNG